LHAPALRCINEAYLRLGGFVGDAPWSTRKFHTTDVCVIVKTDW